MHHQKLAEFNRHGRVLKRTLVLAKCLAQVLVSCSTSSNKLPLTQLQENKKWNREYIVLSKGDGKTYWQIKGKPTFLSNRSTCVLAEQDSNFVICSALGRLHPSTSSTTQRDTRTQAPLPTYCSITFCGWQTHVGAPAFLTSGLGPELPWHF